MRYMLAVFGLLLLVSLSHAQDQSQPLPNSPPYPTVPNFPDNRQPPAERMPPDQSAPPPRTLSTNEAEQQIRQHLNSEAALSDVTIDVLVDEASVVLTGTVDSEQQHNVAVRIAHSYAGERKVIDKIAVRKPEAQ